MHVTTADISLELLLGPQLTAFAAAGYDVVGVSSPGPFVDQVRARGVEHVALHNATRSMNLGADIGALRELVDLFRIRRPDVVHTHNPKTGVYGRIAARIAGVPAIVNTVHGIYATPEDPWVRRMLVYTAERIAATCSDLELVQNPEDIDTLRRLRVPAGKLRLLGNGVDLKRFKQRPEVRSQVRAELSIDDDTVVVGAVGRLVREKGYLELFEAWKRVRAAAPAAVLLVVGPHEPEKADGIGADVIVAAEASGVRFLGMRDDVDRLYQAFDTYVLLSYREGYPRSAMEAAACGLPVIATDIRGCRQVVVDGTTGVLVPSHDADAAATAIIALVHDADRRRSMSVAALGRAADHFDQEQVIRTSLTAYADLLIASGSTAPPPSTADTDSPEGAT